MQKLPDFYALYQVPLLETGRILASDQSGRAPV